MATHVSQPWWMALLIPALTGLGVLWMEHTRTDRVDIQRLATVEAKVDGLQKGQDDIKSEVDQLFSWALGTKPAR